MIEHLDSILFPIWFFVFLNVITSDVKNIYKIIVSLIFVFLFIFGVERWI